MNFSIPIINHNKDLNEYFCLTWNKEKYIVKLVFTVYQKLISVTVLNHNWFSFFFQMHAFTFMSLLCFSIIIAAIIGEISHLYWPINSQNVGFRSLRESWESIIYLETYHCGLKSRKKPGSRSKKQKCFQNIYYFKLWGCGFITHNQFYIHNFFPLFLTHCDMVLGHTAKKVLVVIL